MPTTHGFVGFKDFVPAADATIVTRLKRAGADSRQSDDGRVRVWIHQLSVRSDSQRVRSTPEREWVVGRNRLRHCRQLRRTIGIGEDTGGSIRGPAAVDNVVGLRPTLPLVSRHGMSPARPSTDTLGPITRTVRDTAIVAPTVIAGYDPLDPVTASAVGHTPAWYTDALVRNGSCKALASASSDSRCTPRPIRSPGYRKVRTIFDRAVGELRTLGAQFVDPSRSRISSSASTRPFDANVFETEAALNQYLAEHRAPFATLREILLSGRMAPSRALTLMSAVGKSTDDIGYLQVLRSSGGHASTGTRADGGSEAGRVDVRDLRSPTRRHRR